MSDSDAALRACGIWKEYRRGEPVLRGVDISVGRGELVSITGENGSGKSTLLNILSGSCEPTTGEVVAAGRIGYCPQEPALYPRLTVNEHFDLYGHAGQLLSADVAQLREHVLNTLQFSAFANHQVRQLSGGTRAKLNLALSLLGRPSILILDEPYAAFDLASYLAFWALIDEQREAGCAILIVSHLELDGDRFSVRQELTDGILAPIDGSPA